MQPVKIKMSRRTTWVALGTGLMALAAASIGAGCCSREGSEPALPPSPPEVGLCVALRDVTAPTFDPTPAVETPDSRVILDVSITRARLLRELGKQVPKQLAQESGRSIGAPGRVSYVVTRGDFDLSLADTRLTVSIPITVQAKVCKPLGPVCVQYGSCRPQLMAQASLPLVLDEQYRMGQSQVSVEVTKPCVVAGFNATGQIRRVANQQAKRAKRQIDRNLPPVHESVAEAWKRLGRPIELESGACVRIEPETAAQSHPRLTPAQLSTRAAVTGKVSWEAKCGERMGEASSRPLPELETKPKLDDGSVLRVALTRTWAAANDDVTRSLQDARAGGRLVGEPLVERASLSGATIDGEPAIVIEVQLAGDGCGTLWLVGGAAYDAAQKRLRLRGLHPVARDLSETAARQAGEVAAGLEQHASIALPPELAGAAQQLQRAAAQLSEQKPEDLELSVKLSEPRIERIVPAPDGLVTIATVNATLSATAK